jgi:hypothetical protein
MAISRNFSCAAQDINEDCPRYVCFAAGDSYVETIDDLDELIGAVAPPARIRDAPGRSSGTRLRTEAGSFSAND